MCNSVLFRQSKEAVSIGINLKIQQWILNTDNELFCILKLCIEDLQELLTDKNNLY